VRSERVIAARMRLIAIRKPAAAFRTTPHLWTGGAGFHGRANL
jgi:hypothetical protein